MKKVKDYYFQKAKAQGYVARSIYKLEEINQKHRIIKPGNRVVDLGCYPGSWMQYINQAVGNSGLVVGVDLNEITIPLKKNMIFLQSDIGELDIDSLGQYANIFDVICSDMAPKTTGTKSIDAERSYQLCQMAELVAQKWLITGGNLVVKIFQGAPMDRLIAELKENYQTVKRFKPKSSRNESVEIFVLGLGKNKNKGYHDNNFMCQKR